MNIIALDIDDCILPSNQTYLGQTEDSLTLLEINLKRLVMMCNKWDMKIFIISAWSSNLEVDSNGNLSLIHHSLGSLEYNGNLSSDLICKYLSGFVLGVKDVTKEKAILNMLEHGHNVITIEDTDFSHIVHPNHLFCEVNGLITNKHSYDIKRFIESKRLCK